ncbi:MAG: hypothetical protein LBB45_09045 [Methanobrevibacter sp.]|jgi:hypothetical protein|nr:hypothetical protein [Candidatus Methanovirga basalitermitum]
MVQGVKQLDENGNMIYKAEIRIRDKEPVLSVSRYDNLGTVISHSILFVKVDGIYIQDDTSTIPHKIGTGNYHGDNETINLLDEVFSVIVSDDLNNLLKIDKVNNGLFVDKTDINCMSAVYTIDTKKRRGF